MNCELCGREAELYTAEIEGTTLKVCEKCSSMGKVIKRPAPPKVKKPVKKKFVRKAEPVKEIVEAVVEDYAKKIRQAREKTGMTQKEFARKLNEKESILHKLETGSFKPSLALAKKLEKLLHIKLVEQREEEKEQVTPKTGKSSGLTIGDIIKF